MKNQALRITALGMYFLFVSACGGGSGGGNNSQPPSVPSQVISEPANTAPAIDISSTVTVQENQISVLTAVVSDADSGDTLTLSISGGQDAGLFSIDNESGLITFNTAPDYEAPSDADATNDYEIQVSVSDGKESVARSVIISVSDVNDVPAEAGSSNSSETSQGPGSSETLLASCFQTNRDNISLCQGSFSSIDRSFYVYEPDAYAINTDTHVSALLSLHGGGDYAEYNIDYTGFTGLADRDNFLVIYPQGIADSQKGTTGWYAGYSDGLDTIDDTAFFSALIDWLGQNYRVNLDRVFVTGFSQGAHMSYQLGCALSSKLAGIAAVAGSMSTDTYDSCSPSVPTNVIHIHGNNDVNPYSISSEISVAPETAFAFWSDYNQCLTNQQTALADINGDGVSGTNDSSTGCSGERSVQLLRLDNFGHEWPSNSSSYGGSDINASDVIWSFFKQYDIDGKIPSISENISLSQSIFTSGQLKYSNEEFIGNGEIDVYYHVPSEISDSTPILFTFHGLNRNADDYRDAMILKADELGFIVVAPEFSDQLFPGGDGYNLGNVYIDGDNPSPSTLNEESEWAYSLVEPLFDHMKQMTGNLSTQYYVFGNSAGAQFAQRLMLFKPEARIKHAIVSAPGWYTTIDAGTDFPYGLNASILESSDLEGLFAKNLTITVGDADTRTGGNVRSNNIVNRQGVNRLERAQYFYDQARDRATALNTPFNWNFVIHENMGHDFEQASSKGADILFQ